MNTTGTLPQNTPRNTGSRSAPLYLCLLSVQTIGVGVLLSNVVPLYRTLALSFSNYKPDEQPWWMITVVVVQAAYWLVLWLRLAPPWTGHNVLGHVAFFISRITFVSVTAGFTTMFLTRFPDLRELQYPPLRAILILLMFFSIFCWTLEVERMAKALMEPEKRT